MEPSSHDREHEGIAGESQTASESQADLEYAQAIVATVREPLVVLDASLRVISANRAFHQTFSTKPGEI
jgi:PAS domain-containing protein